MNTQCLHILWVNDNPVTAENMVFMYATNALLKGWWKEVHLIIWGATAKLICEDTALQALLKKFHDAGGHVSACRRCAENLHVLEQMEKIEGIDEVIYIGENFTKILKDGEKLLTV